MKKIYFVLFAILCTVVFSCTDNLISTEFDSNKNFNTSELRVFVKESRLYSPEANNISWSIKLVDNKKNSYTPKINGSYYLFTGLQSGIYSVTASGKDSSGIERFAGEITFNFDSEKQLEIHVPVSASKNSDVSSYGKAKIRFVMSDLLKSIIFNSHAQFSAVLTSVANEDDIYTASIFDINSITLFDNQDVLFVLADPTQGTPTSDIPVGYYNLSFEGLEKDFYSLKLIDCLVEIGDGLTTNIVLTENDYEIVKNYSSILYVNNEGSDSNGGTTLSDPIAFSHLNSELLSEYVLIYLLSDVEFIIDESSNTVPDLSNSSKFTISSFGSTIRTVKSNKSGDSRPVIFPTGTYTPATLRNVKLSGTNEFYFTNLNLEETVIFDCEMGADSPCVQLSKTSNLQIGQNFSGNLYLSLSQENWKVGDTVINFENGKPENSNFYIEENCCNSEFQNYSSMFYIDDSGKLAKYTDDFTAFAWTGEIPYLVTKTQIKNNTYTNINTIRSYDNFTGVSTYDGDKTWYFVCEYEQSYSLYKVSPSQNYENSVDANVVELPVSDTNEGIPLNSVQAMSYDDGKLYFLSQVDYYQIDSYDISSGELGVYNVVIKLSDDTYPSPTAFYVKGNDFYFATTYTDNSQNITHSAIWKCVLTDNANGGYDLNHIQTCKGADGADYPVPYYLTQNDEFLTITDDLSGYSNLPAPTFRITDLYSDGNSVYGLLANYIETNDRNANSNVYMRGSVFKLEENTNRVAETYEPIMNAIQDSLRETFPLSSTDLPLAKQYFILPRKIVGIINKKLIIADDGVIPDEDDCNLDRFILFDLDGNISEKIDVNFVFTTNVHASDYNYDGSKDFVTGYLF